MKVKIFNKKLVENYLSVTTVISLVFSFVLIVVKIPDNNCIRFIIGLTLFLVLVLVYLYLWIKANKQNETTLIINNSKLVVKIGDIFEEEGLKVIAFNEYFDTKVDNVIISENTLNGKFINEKIENLIEFDQELERDSRLIRNFVENNDNRVSGKKKRYRLGTTYEFNGYLITAFSRFDEDNRAFLNLDDYINFLLNFWNEIDIVYNGRSVSIPILGSGITRFKGYDNITEQELVDLLIWSFKVSRTKFSYPSKVSIIVHSSMKDKINFFKLKN
jgi:hypothetical protein